MEKQNIAKINEIFKSIQGEGKYLGANQVFVRFSKCNLSCKFCDTPFLEGKEYNVPTLTQKLSSFDLAKVHSISFTGGEPLMFVDFLDEFLENFKPIKEKYNLKIYLKQTAHFIKIWKKLLKKLILFQWI
ncbi:MAG: 7-carboxy-7-deazaguanine synthase QueE [Candidatus Melainabacteria bacterium]|nr:MAG: 7-carboxy-7-deazaguanine synthase QueE [Candidatus Melainabacteria bacterium]